MIRHVVPRSAETDSAIRAYEDLVLKVADLGVKVFGASFELRDAARGLIQTYRRLGGSGRLLETESEVDERLKTSILRQLEGSRRGLETTELRELVGLAEDDRETREHWYRLMKELRQSNDVLRIEGRDQISYRRIRVEEKVS